MLAQVVTIVWGTKLGTTLLNGFNSTTEGSAYFRCLLLPLESQKLASGAKFLSGMVPSCGPIASKEPLS